MARRRKEEKEEREEKRGEGSTAKGSRQRAAPVEEGASRMKGDEEKLGGLALNEVVGEDETDIQKDLNSG